MPTPRMVAAGIVAMLLVGSAPRTISSVQDQPPSAEQPQAPLDAPAPGALSPRNASYSINARLDPATRTLTGDELLSWRNIAGIETRELQFHLYYNAWRNTDSTWLRERALARGRSLNARPERDWGWIDVRAIRLLPPDGPPVDLTSRARFIAPDDGNAQDRTVMAVSLDEAVATGQTINVQIEWTSRVPRTAPIRVPRAVPRAA